MSKEYREKQPESMREWCKRPGKVDEKGKIQYFTEQAHKKECDINNIIKKYDKTGLITHVSKIEAKFGDLTGRDFKVMSDKVAQMNSAFELLPVEIKKEFEQSPAKLLEFMENPDNRERAIELGLIDRDWTEETDGLGEHVLEGGNVKKVEEKKPEESKPA